MPFVPASVRFDIATPDNLRDIHLTLTSAQGPSGAENWTIDLEVWEKNNLLCSLQLIGKVSVTLSPDDFAGARTIVQAGLCTGQRAQALLAAETIEANQDGIATADDAHDAVVKIVRVD